MQTYKELKVILPKQGNNVCTCDACKNLAEANQCVLRYLIEYTDVSNLSVVFSSFLQYAAVFYSRKL